MQKTGEIEQLKFLVATYKAETDILTAQNSDILNQINQRVATSYNNGFEDGRTQAGVSFLHDGTMQSYADGYHAAISQYGTADTDTIPNMPVIDIPRVSESEEMELLRLVEEELEDNELLFQLLEEVPLDTEKVLEVLDRDAD